VDQGSLTGVLRGFGIEIDDREAASVGSGGTGNVYNELPEIRQPIDCLTDRVDVKDGLRTAIEQGKAFRFYKRHEIDKPN
jgi:hypothetical protein